MAEEHEQRRLWEAKNNRSTPFDDDTDFLLSFICDHCLNEKTGLINRREQWINSLLELCRTGK